VNKRVKLSKRYLTTRNLALVAIFAALYYVLSLVTPFVPAVGLPEITISLEALIASIFGIVLGPYLGMLTAFLGAFVTWTLPPTGMSPFALPFLLSPPINALITGLIFYRKWKYSFVVFAVLISAFLFTPPVQPLTEHWYVAVAVLFDKIIALFLIFPVVMFAKKLSFAKASLFYFLLFFIGNQADNMWGSFAFSLPVVYQGIFGLPLEGEFGVRFLFTLSPFAYPAIRLIQAFIGMLIAVPLMRTLMETPWLWKAKNILPFNHETADTTNSK
jgi:hypothetical protein